SEFRITRDCGVLSAFILSFSLFVNLENRSKPGVAAVVACMMPFMLGFCFLCPSMDCLWSKQHHCPQCGNKVADFGKSDPCLVMDPPQWKQPSFALPA
ncbi:GSH-induced LITAF domain protein-like, partial [Raphanus sativus]|uniref:GSH-induced LITAF domain protein-like n=1 Tax=Raphanus sativus TaxID=3726 RepID=A0A6J0MD57_RAPSA